MAKAKPAEDTRTQRQKFIDAAREVGASDSEAIFERALRKVAKSPMAKAELILFVLALSLAAAAIMIVGGILPGMN